MIYLSDGQLKAPQLLAEIFVIPSVPPPSCEDLVPWFRFLGGEFDRNQRSPKLVVLVLLHLVLEFHDCQIASPLLIKHVGDGDVELSSFMVGRSKSKVSEMGDAILAALDASL